MNGEVTGSENSLVGGQNLVGAELGTVPMGPGPPMASPTCISPLIAMKVSPNVWSFVGMLDLEPEFVWKGGRICKGERKSVVIGGREKKLGSDSYYGS